jgi:DNA polymerase bacteriophage-type
MSYAFDDEDVQTWTPRQVFPQKVSAVILSGAQIRAHNAAFERLIFWYVICPDYGVPEPALTQFYCTAAQARANCAPGSLEDVGRFAGAGMRKDHRGAALVRALSIPQANGTFREDAALMQEMIEYCEQDVRAMRAFSKAMRGLTDEELLDYHVNERINDRGVRLDRPLAQAAVKYAAAEQEEIETIFREITGLTSVRSPRMREWVLERVGPQARAMMMVEDVKIKDASKKQEQKEHLVRKGLLGDDIYTSKLVHLENKRFKVSIDKTVRSNLLAMENPDEVPPEVHEVVQCADDLWASSVAKFERAAALSDDLDSRVRGAFVFAGGSATGRASSYGLQVHNFPRKCARDPELARQALVRGHQIVPEFGKRVTDVLKSMLRPALIPAEGKSFAVFDYAQIEARVTPWLSMDGEETLDVFREGRDIYVAVAARMFNVEETAVTDEQRQLGKVAVLACGFGGGVGAFSAMGRVYGVHMPESEARRTVDLWRRANPWAVPFWSDLEQAYTRAIRNPGEVFKAGRVQYMKQGDHLWYALPSGRVLCYPYARFEEDGVSYAKASWKPAADAKEWPRARLWRGLACENIVQATANDILREALRGLDAAGVEVVLHVHDEIVAEVDTEKSAELAAAMQAVMVTPPAWAEGLPLGASGKVMQRYGK